MGKLFEFTVFMLLSCLLLNCTREIHRIEPVEVKDGLYDSEFPTKATSESLEKIFKSVKLLSTIAFYESFEFSEESAITLAELDTGDVEEKSISKYHFNQPATGTATVAYSYGRKVALLTCAHIVSFPDTVFAYFRDEEGQETEYIQTIAFKIRQNINIIDFHLGGDFEILAMDRDKDIAFIGKHMTIDTPFMINVFNHPIGAAGELTWGSFIYVLGYPRGEQMITSGIVSRPSRDKKGAFTIDAVFNRGFSGGIVLALRDGAPNFELVGMAKSVPAESKLYLAPEHHFKILETSPYETYRGDIRVQTHENIFYGITYAITAESIIEFINKNADKLVNSGYQISSFFPVK